MTKQSQKHDKSHKRGKQGAHSKRAETPQGKQQQRKQQHAEVPRGEHGEVSRGEHGEVQRDASVQLTPSKHSARAGGRLLCPVEHACGACQHISEPYPEQLRRKDAYVANLFADLVDSAVIRPILGMEDPFHYRNKVVSPYAPGKKLASGAREGAGAPAGSKKHTRKGASRGTMQRRGGAVPREILCGMYAAGTHRLVSTEGCLIENEQAKRVIYAVRSLMPKFGLEPYNEDTGRGFLRHAVVRVGHESGEMLVTLVTNGRDFPASRAFCRELVKRVSAITTVVQNINERQTNVILGDREQTLYGPGFILDRLCGLSFRISSQSFYQVNSQQTEVLYRTAIDLAHLSGSETVIDAYCGTGTIGLVAAKSGAARVIGVDSVASSIRDARQNAQHNGVENAQFVIQDATEFMREQARVKQQVDVLLMDPPRAGSTPAFLQAAAALSPARIVYISCNPQTQVRDVALLCEQGYVVEAVQPVDMFPHTDHVEVICQLRKI